MRNKRHKSSAKAKKKSTADEPITVKQSTPPVNSCHNSLTESSQSAGGDQVTDESHMRKVQEMLISFQQEALFCDTVLITRDGGRVYAHSAVLAAVCPALLSILNQHPYSHHQPNVIDLSLYEHSLVLDLIQFIYVGRLGYDVKERSQLNDLLSMLGVTLKNENNDIEKANNESANEMNSTESQNKIVEQSVLVQSERIRRVQIKKKNLHSPSHKGTRRKRNTASTISISDRIGNNGRAVKTVPICKEETLALTETFKTTGILPSDDSMLCSTIVHEEHFIGKSQEKEIQNELNDDACDSKNLQSDKSKHESISYKCSECTETFTSRYHLSRHHWAHFLTESGAYQCKHCPKTFESIKSFRQHSKTHLSTPSKRYECEICGHSFSHPCRLRSHMSKHTGTLSFICDVCGQRFSRSEYLTVHKRRHSGDMRYSCHICERRFYNWPAKMAHVRMHTREKPYQCSVCGYQFSQCNSLQLHMRVHTGERPYPCSQCSMAFRVASHLKKHILNKHVDVSERPFACERCARTFSTGSALKQHMLTHLGLQPRRPRRRHGAATAASRAAPQRQPGQKVLSRQQQIVPDQPETVEHVRESVSGQIVSSVSVDRISGNSCVTVPAPDLTTELLGGRSELTRRLVASDRFVDVTSTIMLGDTYLTRANEIMGGNLGSLRGTRLIAGNSQDIIAPEVLQNLNIVLDKSIWTFKNENDST